NKQLAVTYEHEAGGWQGPVPELEGERLARTLEKLRSGEPLTVVLYGDSIAEGYNASGFASQEEPVSPFMPSWGELFAENLRRRYASEIRYTKAALAGKDSVWGAGHVRSLVTDANPDLVVLAFGMNDGSAQMEPA